MSYRHLVHVVSIILIAVAGSLALSGVVALLYGDGDFLAFLAAAAVTVAAGVVGYRRTRLRRDLTVREGYAVVSLSWMAIGVAGALPYLFSGVIGSPAAALFESVSGFTTTGATVFADIEALPHGILFWRALTQWLGGMGIIVLGVAILPYLGIGGMQLFRAEVPGVSEERLAPRIAQTAKLLWFVYAGLTVLQIVLYRLGDMPLFDAVTHAFTTMSTGGFSTRNASLAAFDSPYIQWVTIAFMYLAGINFTLHYRALSGRPGRLWRDAEWRTYTFIVLAACTVMLGALLPAAAFAGEGAEPAVRGVAFQVVSIATTTGYTSRDYDLWPAAAQMVLLMLMFIGGMAGSTAGGMKVARVMILVRHSLAALRKALHPRAVVVTRFGKAALRDDDMLEILAFVLFFLVLFIGGMLTLTFFGYDLITAAGAAAAAIGNIGPGLGELGATDNYSWTGAPTQLLLAFLMLVGRLEIFTVLLLFHPGLWRRSQH